MRAGPLALGLIVLAVLVGGFAWFAMRGDDDPRASAEEHKVTSHRSVAALELASPVVDRTPATLPRPTASEPESLVAEGPGALTGRVVLAPDLTPVASVEVRAGRYGYELVSTVTRDDGRFTLFFDEGTEIGWIEIRSTATSTGKTVRNEYRFFAGLRMDIGDVVVTSGATLAGHVVDEDGAPVPDARVLGWCRRWTRSDPPERTVRTGPDGSFAIEHLGFEFKLVAETDTLACARGLEGELVPGKRVDGLEIVLARSGTFSGRVIDGAGAPVEGASVGSAGGPVPESTSGPGVSSFEVRPSSVKTDADGVFALGRLPARDFLVNVNHAGFLVAKATLEPDVPAEIRLDPGVALRGLVLDADSSPVAGAKVFARGDRMDDLGRGTTDAQGRFDVRALSATERRGTVWVRAKGHAIHVRQGLPIGPGAAEVVLRLERAHSLPGVVLDADGRPVPGARVSIVGDRLLEFDDVGYTQPTTWEWRCGHDVAWTDGTGRFRFVDLYPGSFQLTAGLGNERVRGRARSGEDEVVLRLGTPAKDEVVVEGRVVDGRSGAPLTSFGVTPMFAQSGGSSSGHRRDVTDADGRFRIGGFGPGRFQLTVAAPGYATWGSKPRDSGGGVERFEVALLPSRAIDVIAVDRDGQTLSSGTLSFRSLDGRRLQVESGSGTGTHLSLWQGGARAAGLPAERIVAVLELPDDDREHEVELDLLVQPDGPVELRIDAEADARRAFQALLVVAPEGARPEQVFAELQANGGVLDGDIGWIDAKVRREFRSERGTTLYVATIRPCGGGFCMEGKAASSGSSATLPYPLVDVALPGEASTVAITSERYLEQVVPIEERARDEPLVVILRPR
jgi:protocatechuate 3,4-dioxygenase beta subunit